MFLSCPLRDIFETFWSWYYLGHITVFSFRSSLVAEKFLSQGHGLGSPIHRCDLCGIAYVLTSTEWSIRNCETLCWMSGKVTYTSLVSCIKKTQLIPAAGDIPKETLAQRPQPSPIGRLPRSLPRRNKVRASGLEGSLPHCSLRAMIPEGMLLMQSLSKCLCLVKTLPFIFP